jgi:hypothetical protein
MQEQINFFWIGNTLTKLGQLAIKSFLDNDHNVVLWTYNLNCEGVPKGTVIEDAREILEENKIFYYTGKGDCRKNSLGGFSDLFRYYLLDKVGGWYCDMDVVCLKNFSEIKTPYAFRPNNVTIVTANIIKTPANCELIKECIRRTELEINENNDSWIKPVVIFKESFLKDTTLTKYISPKQYFGDDTLDDLKQMLDLNYYSKKFELPTYAIHWCNEVVSTGQWVQDLKRNWNAPIPTTLYYKLLKKHKLL